MSDITYCVNDTCPLWQRSACGRKTYMSDDRTYTRFYWDVRRTNPGVWMFHCDYYIKRTMKKKDIKPASGEADR